MKSKYVITSLVIAIILVVVVFILIVSNSSHEVVTYNAEDTRPDFNPIPAFTIVSPSTAPKDIVMEKPHIRSPPTDRDMAISSPTPRKRTSGKLKVAFAITMTSDGKGLFHDGAAVLAYSILKTIHTDRRTYDLFESISMVAFVHPNVTQRNRDVLSRLGYHVIEAATPVNIPVIRGDFLREKIDKNGCCGAAELIKLSSYLLLGYDLVLHLDADTYFTGASLHELFSEIVYKNGNAGDSERELHSLVYTTDPNMASHKGQHRMPVQGGFIIFRPSLDDYDAVVGIVMNTEFVQGGAWNRSKIGWFWGGMTIQGVLPYYYNAVSVPNRTLVIDRCKYNTMADTAECTDTDGGRRNTLESGEVVSAHFTVCQKPWGCHIRYWKNRPKEFNGPLCYALHEQWFQLRRETEQFYGMAVSENVCKGRYAQMEFTDLLSVSGSGSSPSLAAILQFGGEKFPSLMKWDNSPDVFHPRPASKFPTIIKDVYV